MFLVGAHFDTKFRVESIHKGHSVRLKCEARGDRPLSISWLKDKTPFSKPPSLVSNEGHLTERYELSDTLSSEGIVSELLIRKVDRRDSALFTCITSNAYGFDDTNIQLIIQGMKWTDKYFSFTV